MFFSRSVPAILAGLIALQSPLPAKSISINFSPRPTTDAESTDAGETAVIGIPGPEAVDGSVWNQIHLRSAASAGTPTSFIAATQGGNQIQLIDSSGLASGVALKSASAANGFYANYANTSHPKSALTGEGGLMQGILLFNNAESLSLSGLSAWAPQGYQVHAFFDIGSVVRTYGIAMTSGGISQSFWTADTSTSIDADVNNDGVVEWLRTSATTSSTVVGNANHAVFGDFNGDTLTITSADGVRAALSGLQIVASSGPAATITSFTASPNPFTTGQSVTLNWDVKDGLNVPESTTSADDYGANLKRFISWIRQQFGSRAGSGGIRFVAGQVLPSAPPGGDVSDAPRPALVAEPAGLRDTVRWNRSAADLLPVVQFSMDLSDWTSHVPTLESIHEFPSGFARLSYSPPLSFAAGFFRTLGRQP